MGCAFVAGAGIAVPVVVSRPLNDMPNVTANSLVVAHKQVYRGVFPVIRNSSGWPSRHPVRVPSPAGRLTLCMVAALPVDELF